MFFICLESTGLCFVLRIRNLLSKLCVLEIIITISAFYRNFIILFTLSSSVSITRTTTKTKTVNSE